MDIMSSTDEVSSRKKQMKNLSWSLYFAIAFPFVPGDITGSPYKEKIEHKWCHHIKSQGLKQLQRISYIGFLQT